MYAIIDEERLEVVYPSLNVTAGDEPIVKSTGNDVGFVSGET